MQLTVTITDDTQILGLQRALAAYNAERGTSLTEEQFVETLVRGQCAGFAAQLLVTRIDPLDFQMRFTDAERAAIRTAAKSNAQIEDYLALLASAKSVVLTDPLTVGGVQQLEAEGLIGPGRGAEILAL